MGSSGAMAELLIYLIFLILAFGAIKLALIYIKKRKIIHLIISIILVSVFFFFLWCIKEGQREQQLEYVGSYHLKHYPNCKYCILTLKEGNTYEVKNGSKILEVGDWHYDSGGDAFIVYMNKDKDRLGDGRFEYLDSTK